jgi:hypothetical protein
MKFRMNGMALDDTRLLLKFPEIDKRNMVPVQTSEVGEMITQFIMGSLN